MTKGKLEYRCNKAHTAFLQIRDTVHAEKFLDVNPLDDIDDCLKVLGLTDFHNFFCVVHVLMIAILIKQSSECSIVMKNQFGIPKIRHKTNRV